MSLKSELGLFWQWAESSPEIYAVLNRLEDRNETDYCTGGLFIAVKELLKRRNLSDDDYNDILTAMAIDNEVEDILDLCSVFASEQQIEGLVKVGINHIQSNARWQIAELLSRRPIKDAEKYLNMLLCDKNAYVRKRAENSSERIK